MKILIACESSGIVRDAFKAKGHDAWSCDLLPTERPGQHLQGDVNAVLSMGWDLIIAHPPCTYLCNSGVRWLHEDQSRWEYLKAGTDFFKMFLNAKRVAIENPIPHKYALNNIGKKYDQIIQPWQFGHEEMKATCLWLKGLPQLKPTNVVGPPPKDKEERKKWAKVHRASPGPDRWKERSRTYEGIARAMADQWG